MRHFMKFATDKRGVAALEFALAGPIVIAMLFGIVQLGVIGNASAGIKNGLGEGARLATIYPSPDANTIQNQIKDKSFGAKRDQIAVNVSAKTLNTSNGLYYRDLTASYDVPLILPVLQHRTYTVSATRRVYVPAI